MLSRDEMRQAERLASGEQDTRDEIGFLLIHQGFADLFFPARRCFILASVTRFSCRGCSRMRLPTSARKATSLPRSGVT